MAARTGQLTYPPEGLGAPKDRRPGPLADVGLPPGTEVFSADNHISLAEDIFYERFPRAMKDRAPRVLYVDGAWVVGVEGTAGPGPRVHRGAHAVRPDSPGSHTDDIEARLAALDSEGIHRELAFPNAVLGAVRLARPGGA